MKSVGTGVMKPASHTKLPNVEDIYPLSPMQQGMLFHSLYEPGSGVYLFQVALELEGWLDAKVFRRAWEELTQRHAVLRTGFLWKNLDEMVQVVRGKVELPWREDDWRMFNQVDRDRAWRQFLEEDRHQEFDLRRAPLFRLALMRVDEKRYYFAYSIHHLLIDGWCQDIMIREVFQFYEAFRTGRELRLPAPGRYREYIGWLQKQDERKIEAFWRQELQGFTNATRLGIDRERIEESLQGSQDQDEITILLGRDLTTRVETFARTLQLTLNTLVQGAWALLLSLYSGDSDVVFGAAVSGRSAPVQGIHSMLGLFFNTLPVRVRISGSETVAGYLKALQNKQAITRDFEYSPLPKVQKWSEVPRGKSLFEYMIVFANYGRNTSVVEQKDSSIKVGILSVLEINNYPLTLTVSPGEDISFRYNFSLRSFDAESMERMLGHFSALLAGMVKISERRLSELSMLTDGEWEQVKNWNRTQQWYGAGLCFHQLFEEQVEKTPEAIALVFGKEQLTYRELDEQANQVGHYLRRMGVGPEMRVGICVERSLEMVVALLGVLKAGGAYLPLDPGYPAERMRYMVEDSQASAVVTQEKWVEKLQPTQAWMVCVDRDAERIGRESKERVEVEIEEENLAYIYYTSGSTGRPKGVAMAHSGIVNYMRWGVEGYEAAGGNGAAVHSSIAVDLTLTNFLPLFTGQKMVLASETPGVEGLVELMQAKPEWSLLKVTPTHLTLLNSRLTPEEMQHSTRVLVIGADNLVAEPTLVWREQAPGVKLLNEYGPTETVVGCSIYRIGEGAPQQGGMPIGKPIANITMYVLDRQGGPLPVGVPGELYIGGIGVARGYWGRPDLTAERFVPDGLSGKEGGRLYQTGDRARFLKDGNLEFLGRMDHQVKIRGYRIEPAEVEAVLSGHPKVQKAMVVVREDEPGEKRLVAYIGAGVEWETLTVTELRGYVKERLPQYMVPSAFVVLEQLPVRASGKIDPKDLPAPERARPAMERTYESPVGETETILARIWAEVLKLDKVGRHDNFFEMGGDSILSLQVIFRSNQAGLPYTPAQIFQHQTVAELAKAAAATLPIDTKEDRVIERAPLTPIQHWTGKRSPFDFPMADLNGSQLDMVIAKTCPPGDPLSLEEIEDIYPLSPIQQGLFLHALQAPDSGAYFEQTIAVLDGELDVSAFKRACLRLVECQPILRTGFVWEDLREPVQVVRRRARLTIEQEDWRGLTQEQQQERLESFLQRDRLRGFQLSQAPLARVALMRLTETSHQFTLSYHHLLLDGWSVPLLFQDLFSLYEAGRKGKEPDQQSRRPYRDYIAWLEQRDTSKYEAYWREMLKGIKSPTRLRTMQSPLAISTRTAGQGSQTIRLSQEATPGLQSLVRRHRFTLNTVMLAAWALVLSRYSDTDDVLCGVTVAGRPPSLPGVENMLGLFINSLPLRIRIDRRASMLSLCQHLQNQQVEWRQYESSPLVKVHGWSEIPRNQPLFESIFIFQNAPVDDSFLQETSSVAVRDVRFVQEAGYPLVVFVDPGSETLLGMAYDTGRFEQSYIVQMLDDFHALLKDLIREPEQELSCLLPRAGQAPGLPNQVASVPAASAEPYTRSGLTKHQFLIWLGQKLHPDAPIYNMCLSYKIPVAIDPEPFGRAFQALVDQSDALRTVFEEIDGVPQRRLLHSVPCGMEVLDFSSLANPAAAVQTRINKALQRSLPMDQVLFDSALIKTAENEFTWYLIQHHIICDAFSFKLIFDALSELYQLSLEEGLHAAKPLPPFQKYVDYEKNYRESAEYIEASSYWKQKLSANIDPITFYGRTPLKVTTQVQRVSHALGQDLSRKLRVAAEKIAAPTVDVALFNVFASILCAWIYRASQKREFRLGIASHNRQSPEFKKTIGFFMQVFPIEIRIEENDSFVSLANKIKEEVAQSMPYSRYTPENPVHAPHYDVLFNYHKEYTHQFQGVPVVYAMNHSGHGPESLAVQVRTGNHSDSFVLDCDFHCDVFTIEQREQALQHIQLVLDAFASNCDQSLRDLGLLTHAQRRQVLLEFNQTEVAFPRNQSLSQLFEIQAAKSAGKLAVDCQGQSLSYSQLKARVNRLASRLRSLGVGPEVVVALSMQRGIDLLTAILAVFKAGGAYLPLDSSWPPQRFALVLGQSRSSLLLVDTECRSRIVQTLGTAGPRVECVEDLLKQRLLRDKQFPPVEADYLAYVIYTSGSTGMPKGAMVEHGGMLNHLFAKIRDLQLTDKDVVAQTASQCFDISVWQFLAPVLVGGRVSILDDADVRDPARLLDRVRQDGITVLETVPSLLAAIMDNVVDTGAGISDLPALRWLVSTGEALQPRLAQRCLQAFPRISLCNAYGPTECSDDVSHYFMREPLPDHVTTVPIGRPIANTQLYILDDQFEPVLIGAAGELYAAGAGVGRGYLDDPARTAEVFVPNPFSGQPGTRLYKTGDLARHDASGTIEYLGRIDHQVKIRGFRIELGEIEARLMEHSQVQEAAVLAWEKTPGEKVLVAYYTIVASTGEQHLGQEQDADSVGAEQLQAHLVAKLPEYSVPAAYVRLEKLPLTPNGKVDRKALPAPEGSSYPMQAYEPPVGETEAILSRIWAEVLKLDKVGRHDDFFQIGGDSILSIQVVSWSRRAGLHFTPTQLFEHPTIAKLAKAAVASLPIDTSQDPVIGKVPLTPIQQWFFEQNFPNPHRWNQSLLLEVDPSLSVSHMERALQHLIFHHDALRLRFEQTATGWQQAIAAPGETVRLEHVDVSRLSKTKQEAAIESATATAHASLNLGRGPVLHATFFDFGATKRARLLLIIHHLVIDGVSWRILVEDMQALCRQANRGETLRLPPKTSSFKQWAERLTEHAASEAVRREARYWLENSSSTAPGLPVDHRGGMNTEASIQTVSVSLSADETRALLQDFPRVFHTRINDVLLTAVAIAFRGWTGEPSLLVNLEGHGRESVFGDIDLSRTIGWFTDFFPVRLRLDLSVSNPAEALQSVNQQLRRISNGGIGYGLARYLNSDPQTAGALRDLPQPEVVFNYLGQFDALLGDDSLLVPVADNNGPDHDPNGHRSHLLEINAQIAGKQLTVNWGYSRNIHREGTIANLAQRYGDALRSLLKHCQSDQIRTELPKAFVPPRDDWELRLTRMWEEILEIQPIGVKDNFFDLGGHTRLAMRLRSQIHKVSGRELSLAMIFERPTIEALAQVLRQQSPVPVSSLVLINPAGSKPPLFFVHAQGGGAVAYYDLAHRLGNDQPFYGLEPPGRDGQREPLSSIPEMAAHYLESLRRIQPEGPYRLGGHSFGGLVAFEMATQLRKQGIEVAMLAILDTAAPVPGNTVFNPEGFIDEWDDAMIVVSLAKIVARVVRKDLEISREELAGLDYDQRLIYFLEKLKKVDFVSPEEGPSLVRGLLAVERGMAKARRNYVLQGQVYPGLMTLFLSADIAPEDFRARDRKLRDDPVLGWGELVSGAIETHIVPGDHISMLNQPHVQILAQKLASCLDQASRYSPRKESQSA